MLVADAMTKSPVTCRADTPLREVVALFRKNHIGGMPVIEGSALAGVISESDIISLLEAERNSDDIFLPSPFEIIEVPMRDYVNWEKTRRALKNIGDMPAKLIMTRRAITATEEMELGAAAALMIREGISRLPVLRGNTLVGIITRGDIINAIGSSYSADEGSDTQ